MTLPKEPSFKKNYVSKDNFAYFYIYISSLNSLNFVKPLQRRFGDEVVFITLCKLTYEELSKASIKAIYCESYLKIKGLDKFNLFKRLNNRWKYNDLILNLLNEEISSKSSFLFSIKIIDYWGVLIAKYLSFNNQKVKLFYLAKNEPYKKIYRFDIKSFLDQILDSFCYKLKLKRYESGLGLGNYLGVSDDFLESLSVIFLSDDTNIFDKNEISGLKNNNNSYSKRINRLMLGGYSISCCKDFYDTDSVIKIYQKTKESFPDTFHKYHPGIITKDTLSDSFSQVEPTRPIELMDNQIGVLIGGFSGALVSMSNQGVKCVSFLKLVKIKNSFNRDFIIDDLQKKSDNKILFPENMEDYLELIKDIEL